MTVTNKQLVDFCKKALALGDGTMYLYGCWGKTVTQSIIDSKVKQYSYNEKRKSGYEKALKKNSKIRGLDCVGLIKWCLWTNADVTKQPTYNSANDKSANGYYNNATRRGDISKMPEVVGLAVQMDGHIGVYIGDGYVIECTPATKFAKQSHGMGGVCKTKLSDRKWTHYLYIPYITYVSTTTTSTTTKTTTTTTSTVSYYSKYTGDSSSIDVIFKAIGVPEKYRGNYKNRIPVAKANGISNYEGTATQNTTLKKLARNGKLKKV